jgi:hypothetical protein
MWPQSTDEYSIAEWPSVFGNARILPLQGGG